ncbi:PKD domain-containing protein [Dactylosporangium sp. CS-047395]|uniref:PKD domain-containing protein n=1 Tax=Dactylosporangium sp. CS-047395 TaxID=3239936 RepID=UPI003D8C5C1D
MYLRGLLAAVTAGTALVALPAHAASAAPTTPHPIVFLGNDLYEGLLIGERDTGNYLTEIDGLNHPRAVTAAPNGAVYVANHGGTTVTVLDAGGGLTGTVSGLNKPYALAVAPDGRKVFVADDGDTVLAAVDTATRQVTARLTLPAKARALAVSPDGTRIYAPLTDTDQLAVVDAAALTQTALVTVGDEPSAVAVAPDGRRAYVPNRAGNTVSVVDTATNTVTATVPVGTHPAGAAVTPDGRTVYVANNGSKSVALIDTATAALRRFITVGDAPSGVSITPDGKLAQITSDLERLDVVDTATGAVSTYGMAYPVTSLAYAAAVPPAPTASLNVTGVTYQDLAITAAGYTSRPGWESPLTFVFDFGDGTAPVTDTVGTVQHTYARTGNYTVTLTVTDKFGQSATTTRTASVHRLLAREMLMTGGNNKYVVVDALNVQGTGTDGGPAFDVLEIDATTIALRSGSFYVTVLADGTLLANVTQLTPSSYFRQTANADGSFSLTSLATGKYVSSNFGGRPLSADRTTIGPWEKFHRVEWFNAGNSLRANANNRYVTADNGGNSPLIANRTQLGAWERFDIVDAGDGYVALYSHANHRFVTADNGGNSPLIANRTDIGPWEKFTMTANPTGGVTFRALANGNYVTADNGGNAPLIANRTTVGSWETFYNAQ